VLLVSSFNPAAGDVLAHVQRFDTVFTIESHYVTGGLGSWVAEVIAEAGVPCGWCRCG